ncbi:MAG: VanZ family protein [Candidatus Nanoarchaeia archaeon]|nr:VanZ family protein [Candidatus Nanoarchaeia archaeon]
MKLKSFIYYWLPVIIYAGVIFYFSSLAQPIPEGGLEFQRKDLLLHAMEYLVLSALLLRAFLNSSVKKAFVYSILIASAYGITDEIHQLFVPGRVFSVYDILANAFGACLILLFLFHKNAKSFKTKKGAL